jgi:hypothetical protein
MIEKILSILSLFGIIWLIHIIIIGSACSFCWKLGEQRVNWMWYDHLTIILPFLIWLSLMISDNSNKSLANLAEGIFLGLFISLSPIIRIIIGKPKERKNEEGIALGLIALCCLAAFYLWKYMPLLPE